MITKNLEVINKRGMHVRPASLLAKAVSLYDCNVVVDNNGITAEAKNPMQLLTLAAECGTVLKVSVDGPEEQDCMKDIEELFKDD